MSLAMVPLNLEQRRYAINTEQLFAVWQEARQRLKGYRGSMGWKRINGHEYLIRQDGARSVRKTKSLGPRSEATEAVLNEFVSGKEQAKLRYDGMSSQMQQYARMNKALDLGRVPLLPSKVIRSLNDHGLLGSNIIVVGTNCIYAYEAAAAVHVDFPLLDTADLDLMLDSRRRLRLIVEKDSPVLLQALQKADPTFSRGRNRAAAINASGYQVDLVKATPHAVITTTEPDGLGGSTDLLASHIDNMRWIESAPKFQAMAIGEDGLPVPMVCPDPRAYALYKLWMGTQVATRDPRKRQRDVAQAHAVAEIVNEHLPQYPFLPEHVTCFPRRVTELASSFFDL